VFASQPTRLFLHGFYICGAVIELWVFDRSGLYSSEVFDISKTPDRFLTAIAGYALMSDAELRVNALIQEDGVGKYSLCRAGDEKDAVRLHLEDPPFFARKYQKPCKRRTYLSSSEIGSGAMELCGQVQVT
jgi:hypothetical protein